MIDTAAIRDYLAACTDTAEATAHITAMGLTVAEIRSLAASLGVWLTGRPNKAEAIRQIVYWRVGARLNSQAIRRPYYAR